jgi:predicted Zn-ribbon and HTH transcriptional regulator
VSAAVRIAVSREFEADTEPCGHRFQPIRDPSRFPVCPKCKELAAMLWGPD